MTHKVAYTNARLLDPATATDSRGDVLTIDGAIADVGDLFKDGTPDDSTVVDCAGQCLAPGLIDMMAALGEPAIAAEIAEDEEKLFDRSKIRFCTIEEVESDARV